MVNPTLQLLRLATLLVKVLPSKLSDKIAVLIGRFFCLILKERRGYILKNLYYIFPEYRRKRSIIIKLTKRTFENFALCMVDFLKLGFINKERIVEEVRAVNLKNLTQALSYRKGGVLLTLHIGNWDYAGAYLSAMGFPMLALVEETEHEMFKFYTRNRERTGLKTYPLSKSAYAFIDIIKNNRILAVLADRDITKQGIVVNFFSGKRRIPHNLGEIVVKKRLPVLFGYMVLDHSNGKKRYLGVVEPPVFFTGVDEFNRFMVKKFEETIKKYPDQWFVFQPEWID